MDLHTIKEKVLGIKLIAEMLQNIEDYEDLEELKKMLQDKMKRIALMI